MNRSSKSYDAGFANAACVVDQETGYGFHRTAVSSRLMQIKNERASAIRY
jgi:hypothetical protein